MNKPKEMWKTVLVIWTDYNPAQMELGTLAREAEVGDAFCSKQEVSHIKDYVNDPDWIDTDFFGDEERFA